jgi:hypothetical protein
VRRERRWADVGRRERMLSARKVTEGVRPSAERRVGL